MCETPKHPSTKFPNRSYEDKYFQFTHTTANFANEVAEKARCFEERLERLEKTLALEYKYKDPPLKARIICLCGSTRFHNEFVKTNFELTMKGIIVLSVGVFARGFDVQEITNAEKNMLNELHRRKIDLADSILVLNVGGYMGSGTLDEIEYAKAHNKPVHYLEPYNT